MKTLDISILIFLISTTVWLRDFFRYFKHIMKGTKVIGRILNVDIGPKGSCKPLVEFEYNKEKIMDKPIQFIYDPKYSMDEVVDVYILDNSDHTFIIKNNKILVNETLILFFFWFISIVLLLST